MTQIHYMKQGDLLPTLQARLTRTDPVTLAVSYVDLTAATDVNFLMKNAISGLVVDNQNATRGNQMTTPGLVEYTWQAGDTDAAGKFQGEFEVIWASGKPETFPGDSYLVINIKASLDGV